MKRIALFPGSFDPITKGHEAIVKRGLSNADFEYETNIAQMNSALSPTIETVFILTSPELSAISSTVVRDVLRYNGNAAQFLPQNVRV